MKHIKQSKGSRLDTSQRKQEKAFRRLRKQGGNKHIIANILSGVV